MKCICIENYKDEFQANELYTYIISNTINNIYEDSPTYYHPFPKDSKLTDYYLFPDIFHKHFIDLVTYRNNQVNKIINE